MSMDDLKEKLLAAINKENLLETINEFNHLYRYSGKEEGERAAKYIESKLQEYGVDYETVTYDGFFSIPVFAELKVKNRFYELVGDVYSKEAYHLTGELVYDQWSEASSPLTELEEEQRMARFKDKIVLTWGARGRSSLATFARQAREAGALAVLHICKTKGHYCHHTNIGIIWGTPGFDEVPYMQFLPAAGLYREDGEELIQIISNNDSVLGDLTIRMDTKIRKSSIVVANIPGKSPNYVLVSNHYDSWYEGITDNAVADAISLEYARIFQKKQDQLTRGIRIAWWSGHSDARFSGSTYYCDSHWSDLRQHCVAHVNLDLTGCKNSDQIRCRTTCTEGMAFTAKKILKYTGTEPHEYIPMIRGADQSFWGVNVPITIMLKYEPKPENRLSDCPSGGPWWHTPEDRIDKLDEKIMMRDAAINLEIIEELEAAAPLPVKIPEFMEEYTKRLQKILSQLGSSFNAEPIKESWNELRRAMDVVAEKQSAGKLQDIDIKETVGRLLHVIYCHDSETTHDYGDSFGIFKALDKFRGLEEKNCSRAYFTIAKTDFLRTRNRLIHGFSEVIDYISHL